MSWACAKFIFASMRFNSFSILRDWRGVSETLVISIVSQDFWIVPWVQNPSFHHTYQNLDLSSFSPRFSPTQYCSLTKPSTSELFWVLYRFVVKMSYCTIVQASFKLGLSRSDFCMTMPKSCVDCCLRQALRIIHLLVPFIGESALTRCRPLLTFQKVELINIEMESLR